MEEMFWRLARRRSLIWPDRILYTRLVLLVQFCYWKQIAAATKSAFLENSVSGGRTNGLSAQKDVLWLLCSVAAATGQCLMVTERCFVKPQNGLWSQSDVLWPEVNHRTLFGGRTILFHSPWPQNNYISPRRNVLGQNHVLCQQLRPHNIVLWPHRRPQRLFRSGYKSRHDQHSVINDLSQVLALNTIDI